MGFRQPGLRKRVDHEATGIAHQHRLLRELLTEVSRALEEGSRSRCQQCVSRLRSALRAHFVLEEDVVFPAFHGLHPECGDEIESLCHGHSRLWGELERLEFSVEGSDVEQAVALFAALREGLRAHEALEEALLSGKS